MIADLVIFAGSLLILLAGIGVVRFRDVLVRMHAVTKGSVAGIVLVLIGASLSMGNANDNTSLLLAAMLQVLTAPISANLLSRATYHSPDIPHTIDTVDEHPG